MRGDTWLYVGLGIGAVGLVVTVVGLGDKGFQTLELKILGPSVILLGVFVSILIIITAENDFSYLIELHFPFI